jgi:hypothetical protein
LILFILTSSVGSSFSSFGGNQLTNVCPRETFYGNIEKINNCGADFFCN